MTAVAELDTPAVVVDLDVLERNVAHVAKYAARHDLALWPHVKTHKTRAIAERQLAAGAAGLTVSKPEEARAFAALGAPLLLHYPAYGSAKWTLLAEVAGRIPLTVALDSLAVAEPLAAALRARGTSAEVLVELDVGLGRTGVDPAGAAALAEALDGLEGLRVAGLSCYPGHLDGPEGLAEVDALLRAARAAFEARGLRCERVSGGSTATAFAAHETAMTEVRPGNYVFLDRAASTDVLERALHVHATVVSTSVPGRAVLDAGSKTLSEAGPRAGQAGYGELVRHPGVTIAVLMEEHALCDADGTLCVGDRVAIVPNHVCTCVNLHDELYGVRDGIVEAVLPLIARGAVR